jgi:leader peptidase (prepilin peptidase)/N-methyltransferase
MDPIFAVAAAAFGLIIGSFLNALSFRLHTGLSVAHGRSRCMSCNHTLGVLDLVPVLSYLVLRGRCRYCGSRISLQYPLVEAAAGALSVGVYLNTITMLSFALEFVVWMCILFIVVYDMRHSIIPWGASLLLLGAALVSLFVHNAPSLQTLIAGPILALPLALISLVSLGRWMGWGDSVFELSLGWLLGLSAGLSGLLVGIWTGAILGVLLVLWAQRPWIVTSAGFTMKSELPFAPFLALGAAVAYFFHVDLFSAYFLFW